MRIPNFAQKIADVLKENGYEAYFVGGCVRDWLMGREPHDFDITTNALPEEIKECFTDYTTILTGEKHGTVTVVSGGEKVEVTTYRIDGEYADARRPASVTFTLDVARDLARRDFTMNAICYDGEFVDPYFGREDIEKGIIRTVGDADTRFNEDALRIMRALRFAAVLGFEIEEETQKSIHKNAHLLTKVSAERIYVEFVKLLTGEYAERVLLDYSDVISVFIPEIKECIGFDQKSAYHIYDVYTHMVKATGFAPREKAVRLAAFFHDIGKPECFTIDEKGGHFKGHPRLSAEIAEKVLTRLKVDNETKKTVVNLVKEHQREIIGERKYVKRFLSKYSYEFFDILMPLWRADILAHSEKARAAIDKIEILKALRYEIEAEKDCISLKSLEISGRDLIKTGITDGRKIGEVLNKLLERVMDGDIENKKDRLLAEAEVIHKQMSKS